MIEHRLVQQQRSRPQQTHRPLQRQQGAQHNVPPSVRRNVPPQAGRWTSGAGRQVRNTGGIREERPVVETAVRLGPIHKRIRITITNRSSMRYRMILGREALNGDFLVDVSRKYLLKN